MFCSSCGAQINDETVFCPECGAVQEKAKDSKVAPVKSPKASSAPADAQSVAQVFMDPDEKLLVSLGNCFIYTKVSRFMIFLGILLEIAAAVLGCAADGGEGLLAGLAGGLIPCLILIIAAFFARRIWFFIDYAGGNIQIDAKLIGLSDVQDFHKQIRRAKDALKAKEKDA